jgi:cold shock CspA family protein
MRRLARGRRQWATPRRLRRRRRYGPQVTLAAVWIEARGSSSDALCFASDSRTTPGPVEGVTKVILFGRSDIAAVWAGDYRYATLLVNHLDAVFTASDAMRRRDIDLAQAFQQALESTKRHISRAMAPAVPARDLNRGAAEPGKTTVLVGGYSLVESSYLLLRMQWTQDGQWRVGISRADPARVVFIGDELHSANYVSKQARAHRIPGSEGDWRMEPLAAIHNAAQDRRRPTIGGALQMAKVYMHGNTRAYGFLDADGSGDVLVRATAVDRRAALELEAAGLVVDLSLWNLPSASYRGRHAEATKRRLSRSRRAS